MVNKWRIMRQGLPHSNCLLCLAPAERRLCHGCRRDLPRLGPGCHYCARPLPRPGICPHCQRRPQPLRTHAVCRYEYPVALLIQRLKYRGHSSLGVDLASLMLEQSPEFDPAATCLLPMPLHWRRQLQRGFNQALEIARPLAARLDLPLRTDLARRTRPTRPQADLSGGQRRRNVSGAFHVQTAPPAHVIIVDDVMTSGHTAVALARGLRRAGARHVTLWAFARAGLKGPNGK